eukprot:365491-Chlamydomonas_euryale.AAC.5
MRCRVGLIRLARAALDRLSYPLPPRATLHISSSTPPRASAASLPPRHQYNRQESSHEQAPHSKVTDDRPLPVLQGHPLQCAGRRVMPTPHHTTRSHSHTYMHTCPSSCSWTSSYPEPERRKASWQKACHYN